MSDMTISEAIARQSSITLGWSVDGLKGELVPCLGIDPISLARTPSGECARVDVDPSSCAPLRLPMILGVLRRLGESLPCPRQIFGVFEDRDEGIVIFLPTPRDADRREPSVTLQESK